MKNRDNGGFAMIKKNSHQALKQIRNLNGMEEFKQLIEEWYNVAKNVDKLSSKTGIILPNCLFSTQPGSGLTKILRLMTEFIEEEKLLPFIGDIKCFEFVLDRPNNLDHFAAFSRLVETFRMAAGFRSVYKGIACIDIAEWLHHLEDYRFLSFLQYVADCNDKILFIFIVPPLEIKKSNEIKAVLSSYLRLRYLKIPFPDTDEFYLYIQEGLEKQGFFLEEDAKIVLNETLVILRKAHTFNGYRTLGNLVRDIIYEKSSNGVLEDQNNMITVQDLQLFLPDSQWIKPLITYKVQPNVKMGFALGGK